MNASKIRIIYVNWYCPQGNCSYVVYGGRAGASSRVINIVVNIITRGVPSLCVSMFKRIENTGKRQKEPTDGSLCNPTIPGVNS